MYMLISQIELKFLIREKFFYCFSWWKQSSGNIHDNHWINAVPTWSSREQFSKVSVQQSHPENTETWVWWSEMRLGLCVILKNIQVLRNTDLSNLIGSNNGCHDRGWWGNSKYCKDFKFRLCHFWPMCFRESFNFSGPKVFFPHPILPFVLRRSWTRSVAF